ncbi:hypothetical protein ACFPOB_29020 [Bosea eneae]|uniref:Tail assembly chaperone E/41/14-like protein n=1 Tax=Bosea eneae TaxID=151454 RepID=A0ABW0IZH3_9HYPH
MSKLSISQRAPDAIVEEDDGEQPARGPAVVVESDDDGEPKAGQLPARATLNDDGSVTLALVKPVTLTIRKGDSEKQETYAELTFRELTGADLRLVAQEKDEMKRTILTLARATGMTSIRMNVLFDRLAQRDVGGATAVIAYFQE